MGMFIAEGCSAATSPAYWVSYEVHNVAQDYHTRQVWLVIAPNKKVARAVVNAWCKEKMQRWPGTQAYTTGVRS